MADSFQSEVPKARINLKLDLHTGGASKKTELPLKLLVTGDFSNGQESAPSEALMLQTDMHLHQLINRYMLIKQQTVKP